MEHNVGVVGCEYVGLTIGTCLAHLGHRVTYVDKNEGRVGVLAARCRYAEVFGFYRG